MAVDMRARYFGEFDEGAVPPSFGVLPQAMPQPSAFEVMPMSGAAPIMETSRQATVMPMTQEAVAPMSYDALADRRAAANTPPPERLLSAHTLVKKGFRLERITRLTWGRMKRSALWTLRAMLLSAVLALKALIERLLRPKASAMNSGKTLTSKYNLANAP
jgi:hypothetical protein